MKLNICTSCSGPNRFKNLPEQFAVNFFWARSRSYYSEQNKLLMRCEIFKRELGARKYSFFFWYLKVFRYKGERKVYWWIVRIKANITSILWGTSQSWFWWIECAAVDLIWSGLSLKTNRVFTRIRLTRFRATITLSSTKFVVLPTLV